MEIEIAIGTKLKIRGSDCVVVESSKCSMCMIQKITSGITYADGSSKKCGTKYGGNTSGFSCSKEKRSDKKDIIFKKV